jgi:hypothetical protein
MAEIRTSRNFQHLTETVPSSGDYSAIRWQRFSILMLVRYPDFYESCQSSKSFIGNAEVGYLGDLEAVETYQARSPEPGTFSPAQPDWHLS